MKEIFLLGIVLLFFLFVLAILNNKKKKKPKNKGLPKTHQATSPVEKITDHSTVPANQSADKTSVNFVDGKSTSGGIIAGQMKKEKQAEELKKPIGWVQAKSYDEDVRNTNVNKYVHEDTIELEDVPSEVVNSKKSQVTILVVDDSITVLKFISNLLTKFNYELVNKENGMTALDYLKMTPRFPDLIITDLEMPKMSGAELIQAIRAEQKFNNIPILIVSSNPAPHINLLSEGLVNGIISKPFDKEDFIQQVKYLINNQ